IVPRRGAPRVPVHVLESAALPDHWPRLDAFEGAGYRRAVVPVVRDGAMPIAASLYALAGPAPDCSRASSNR
ncbi:MAG: hypothetical protein ACF8QF_05405, partial [Phycisphaerales bacterium]